MNNAVICIFMIKGSIASPLPIWSVFVMEILLVVGVVVWLATLIYIRRLKRAYMIERCSKIKSQRAELAMSLHVREKDNLVRQIDSVIGKVPKGLPLTADAMSELQAAIRSDSMACSASMRFAETFAKLSPEFVPELHKTYPAVSRTSERLACFLAIGMDTRHIARIMNIRPESVRQARWRLRTQMGLPADKELEEALRELL